MPKKTVTPPASRKTHQSEHAAVSGGKSVEGGSPRPSSPFHALNLRRTRFSSVPLVEIKKNTETDEITFPASVELPRRHVTFNSDVDSDSSLSGIVPSCACLPPAIWDVLTRLEKQFLSNVSPGEVSLDDS
ncbi:hypothetical protein JTE90_023611 [Oedothorax gibbosus]|uniref:Uncharacterized protein n=1 Tax=Oedothorax gibbosus TaxID=931172 RepID=A0AAV6U182_9ARAC|nr:hypothetical protein JTE90_023611 [Oedothorax gibbosus]